MWEECDKMRNEGIRKMCDVKKWADENILTLFSHLGRTNKVSRLSECSGECYESKKRWNESINKCVKEKNELAKGEKKGGWWRVIAVGVAQGINNHTMIWYHSEYFSSCYKALEWILLAVTGSHLGLLNKYFGEKGVEFTFDLRTCSAYILLGSSSSSSNFHDYWLVINS